MRRQAPLVVLVAVAACSVERMPPLAVIHRGNVPAPRRVVVLPSECGAPWCQGLDAAVASELSFRGVEVIELSRLAAIERERTEVRISTIETIDDQTSSSEQRRVTIVGPTYSDVDMWTQRAALAELGVDAIVRVRAAELSTWPARSFALIRITRATDAALVVVTACEVEVSRLDTTAETAERALRCALKGLGP